MPKPHRKSKRRQHAVNQRRKAKHSAHAKPFPEPLDASVVAENSPRIERQPKAPRRAPGGVYLEGASLTPEQEDRARELGYVPDGKGRWHRAT